MHEYEEFARDCKRRIANSETRIKSIGENTSEIDNCDLDRLLPHQGPCLRSRTFEI